MLAVKNLSFGYSKKSEAVLNDLSFKVNKGEIIGLLGVNGCGKSTLLKCLAHILKPCQGTVSILEKNLSLLKRQTIAKHICYVAQKSGDSGFTVFESVLLGRTPYYSFTPTKKDLDITEELIHLMGLKALADRNIEELSGGEYQKVALARSIAQEPDLLLLDEPTNHLDIKNQFEVMNIFSHLVKEHGITSIISIHDINMALQYVDKILLLKNNQIFFYDQKEKLTTKHLKEVYEIDLSINELNGQKYFLPLQK